MQELVNKNFESSIETLQQVIQQKNFSKNEASLILPYIVEDKIQEIEEKLADIHQKIQHVLVIGI